MSLHAAYYNHANGLFCKEDKPVIATKMKVHFIDLIRPDFYFNFNVDMTVGLLIWLKQEIKRVTKYNGRCDSFYFNTDTTSLSGDEYYNKIRDVMSRIFLSRGNGLGRGAFDALYDLTTIKVIPIRYYKTHAPIEWGKSQLDLLEEITQSDTEKTGKVKYISTWHPNSCHPKAVAIYNRTIKISTEGFWYELSYGYRSDHGSSSWQILILPDKNQMFVDFTLAIQRLFKDGFKRGDLRQDGGKYSSRYKIRNQENTE